MISTPRTADHGNVQDGRFAMSSPVIQVGLVLIPDDDNSTRIPLPMPPARPPCQHDGASRPELPFIRAAQTLLPALNGNDVVRAPAGVGAQALGSDGRFIDDLVFSEQEGLLHVRNAPSPAATSCLALAAHIADRVFAPIPRPAWTE